MEGGAPVRTTPLPPWPHFTAEELEAAAAVLRSGKINYWTGEECRLFEREYAAHTGMKYAIALMNGTVALELALMALGVGSGDEVVTTSRTFIASASCAVARGAKPVIADVDRDTGNITAETIRPLLTPRTKAIIVVHLGGRLRSGEWRNVQRQSCGLVRRCELLLVLPGQDHHHRWRGRNARD
jgi:dTDP-4-amino-4,6-dideoxygalactose transaminase